MRVKTWLKDYDFIDVYSFFTVTVYQILFNQEIELKYYQVSKTALELKVDAFTITPATLTMSLFYTVAVYDVVTEEQIVPDPEWLSFNSESMKLKVFTNLISDEGHYYVQIIG
jgi:hypothetical protein